MPATVPLLALLTFNDEEARNWENFFRANPAAADAKVEIAHAHGVREFLNHIFAVEYRYGQFIQNQPASDFAALNRDSLDDVFKLGEEGRANIRRFLESATDADADRQIKFKTLTAGEMSASARKMLMHCMVHSIRHWAQLATAMREQGHATNWKHDFMFSKAMD